MPGIARHLALICPSLATPVATLLIFPLVYTAGKERGTFKGMDALIT